MIKFLYSLIVLITVKTSFAQLNNGLIAKYFFDNGNAKDDLGRHNAKAYGASLTADRFGNANSAYFLHGDFGCYLNLGTSNEIKPRQGSVSLWVKIDHLILSGEGVDINPIMFTRAHNGEDFVEAIFIGYDINTKNINVNTTLSKEKQVGIYASKPSSLREWHHVVMTFDKAFLCFYLDGALDGKVVRDFENQYLAGDSIIIGNWNSKKNKRFFNGCVDDIGIYNRVLTPREVLQLYNAPDPNKSNVIFKWIFIALAILVVIIVSIWMVKRRIKMLLKKEKERNELINKSFEQEIKVLKAQMDPHFIFNSLNTILQFIIIKENDKAERYLTKFSKLIRKLLESNTKDSISLADELDIINKYLEIESIRFDKVFKPSVKIGKGINPENTFIPHMLIQPFVENAIWHGLRLKEGEKQLQISFELLSENCLLCIIEDNGIGRNKSKTDRKIEKDKSLAINFIQQRLDLMSKLNAVNYTLKILDKQNTQGESNGTRVEITLPIIKR
jgi:hypothetical protein